MPNIVFVAADGVRHETQVEPGTTVLEAGQALGLPLEGACEGSMACSTCHVILSEADYDRLSQPSEMEEDLLDLAYGAVPTSRLGCQVVLEDGHDGLELRLPHAARNLLL